VHVALPGVGHGADLEGEHADQPDEQEGDHRGCQADEEVLPDGEDG
jgi:hypothetical protein